jgi:hemolysin-activating ACP:hemolysin acyltransferase
VNTQQVSTEERAGSAPRRSQQGTGANGAGVTEKVRRQAAAMQNSFTLAQVIGVLMRSKLYRQVTLADLEWLVIPPLLAGQFRIGEVKMNDSDATIPATLVLWASVSPEVDQRLMQTESPPLRLAPDEWKSGDILWVTHAVGEPRFLRQLLRKLAETTFKGREVKVFGRDKEGKPTVHRLPTAA